MKYIKLSKEFTTVTTLSKTIAMVTFIVFPLSTFFLGMHYQAMIDLYQQHLRESQLLLSIRVPTPTPEKDNYYLALNDACSSKQSKDCCVKSLNTMKSGGFKLAENNTCPNGFKTNTLRCIDSYQWCEPEPSTQSDSSKWKTYKDPQGRFSIQYPNNINFYEKSTFGNYPVILLSTSENVGFEKYFWLRIKIVSNTSNITLDQLTKDPLQYAMVYGTLPEYSKVSSIKQYNNGQIKGIIYGISYDNGDQSADYDEIAAIHNGNIYIFNMFNKGANVQKEGRKTVDQILSTLKFN